MFRRYRLLIPDNGSNPTSPTPQAGDGGANPQPQAGDPQPTPQAGSGKTPEDYERILADLRKENAGHRTKLKKFEDDEAARTQAQKSEQQKLEERLAELQAAREGDIERLISSEIRLQAAEMGVKPEYLKRVAQMLDRKELETDEASGMPTNVEKLLATLIKEMPFLTGKAQASAGGATNPSRAQSNGSQITEQYVNDLLSGRLPQGTYEALSLGQRNEVQAILSKHRKY